MGPCFRLPLSLSLRREKKNLRRQLSAARLRGRYFRFPRKPMFKFSKIASGFSTERMQKSGFSARGNVRLAAGACGANPWNKNLILTHSRLKAVTRRDRHSRDESEKSVKKEENTPPPTVVSSLLLTLSVPLVAPIFMSHLPTAASDLPSILLIFSQERFSL